MKKFLCYMVGIIALIIVAAGLWIAALFFYDPPLNPQFNHFSTKQQVSDKDNALFLFTGLVVPADQDSIARGHEIVNGSYNEIPHAFQFTPGEINCWIEQKTLSPQTDPACLGKAQLEALISDNKIFLDRIAQLDSYPRFYREGLTNILPGTTQKSVQLYALRAAQISLLSENASDHAIKFWLDDMAFLNRALADQQVNVMKMSLYIPSGLYLELLPLLIDNHPEWASKYSREILSVLEMPKINISALAYQDYLAFSPIESQKRNIAFKANATRNAILKARDHAIEIQNSAKNSGDYEDYFREATKPKTPLLGYNFTGATVSSGIEMGLAYNLRSQYWSSIRRQVLKTYINAKVKNISVDAMPTFLSKASSGIGWDKDAKAIISLERPNIRVIYK